MPRRSARIRAREAALSADEFPSIDTSDSESGDIWCCCGGRDDGRLMLFCDQQSEGCSIRRYHYDCLGLSPSDGQRLCASHENFICPFCIENSAPPRSNMDTIGQDSFFVQDSTDQFKLCIDFLWNNIVTGEQVCDFLISAYDEVLHWRPNIFLIPYGKQASTLLRNLLDYIKLLLRTQF